jgi:murein DD-endopeptidase MepM/ murein hydrolase activator NlpD
MRSSWSGVSWPGSARARWWSSGPTAPAVPEMAAPSTGRRVLVLGTSTLVAAVSGLMAAAAQSPPSPVVPVPVAGPVRQPGPAPAATLGRADLGCPWRQPVDAPVVDWFRPPAHRYGPGNRGLEYGVTPGQDVTAVAGGEVGFVGPVGGRRYIVVAHPSGIRSTYGPLDSIQVARGQSVGAGQLLGTAGQGLHLTARVGDRYLDPAPLLAGRCGRPRLVAAGDTDPG